MFTQEPEKISKRDMLERLQFSKNLPIAIKVCQLLRGEIHEFDIKGMFLDAVCRDNFEEAWMRADDHNKAALQARDWIVGQFRCMTVRNDGWTLYEVYYLKLKFEHGKIRVSPNAINHGEELVYKSLQKFLQQFTPV